MAPACLLSGSHSKESSSTSSMVASDAASRPMPSLHFSLSCCSLLSRISRPACPPTRCERRCQNVTTTRVRHKKSQSPGNSPDSTGHPRGSHQFKMTCIRHPHLKLGLAKFHELRTQYCGRPRPNICFGFCNGVDTREFPSTAAILTSRKLSFSKGASAGLVAASSSRAISFTRETAVFSPSSSATATQHRINRITEMPDCYQPDMPERVLHVTH